jgi:hypothetical protein
MLVAADLEGIVKRLYKNYDDQSKNTAKKPLNRMNQPKKLRNPSQKHLYRHSR